MWVTLPLGPERSTPARSPPSGSARCSKNLPAFRSHEQPWGQRSVHRLVEMVSRSRFGGICVHCCAARVARVAMRVVTRAASGSTSASTTMRASDAPSVAASRLVGKTGSTRVTAPSWCLRRSVNQHKPPRSRINQHFLWLVPARLAGAYVDLPTEQPSVQKGPADSGALMLSPATPQIRVSVGKKNTIGDNFSPFGALLLALRAK